MNNNSGIEQFYNSEEAAKILGVNVSTIKRWTNENKLSCIRTAGGHRKFLFNHLTDFALNMEKPNTKLSLLPLESTQDIIIANHILKGHYPELIDYVLKNALESNRREIQKVINGMYLARYPIEDIYDNLITNVLYEIGKLWEKGKVTVSEEHIAAQCIKDCIIRMQGITSSNGQILGTALCINLSTELHDIALKMVDQLLESKGFQVLFSGQITPVLDLDAVFKKYNPDRVYVSSTYNSDKEAAIADMQIIDQLCEKYDCKLYIGGRGFNDLNMPMPSAVYLRSFHDVAKYI